MEPPPDASPSPSAGVPPRACRSSGSARAPSAPHAAPGEGQSAPPGCGLARRPPAILRCTQRVSAPTWGWPSPLGEALNHRVRVFLKSCRSPRDAHPTRAHPADAMDRDRVGWSLAPLQGRMHRLHRIWAESANSGKARGWVETTLGCALESIKY
jgi:hypothetical protein